MFFCTVILTELSMFRVRLSHFIIKFDWFDWFDIRAFIHLIMPTKAYCLQNLLTYFYFLTFTLGQSGDYCTTDNFAFLLLPQISVYSAINRNSWLSRCRV